MHIDNIAAETHKDMEYISEYLICSDENEAIPKLWKIPISTSMNSSVVI